MWGKIKKNNIFGHPNRVLFEENRRKTDSSSFVTITVVDLIHEM